MNIDDLTEEGHKARSHFIKNLVQNPNSSVIIKYWL